MSDFWEEAAKELKGVGEFPTHAANYFVERMDDPDWPRCAAETKKGKQCKYPVRSRGERYCYLEEHQMQDQGQLF